MSIYQVLLLILVLFLAMTSNVELSDRQCTSSCGDIHNIRYPFRLRSDPKRCGDSKYKLTCEDNHTVLHFRDGRYYVQSINYSTHQIRLIDNGLQKDNCSSLPSHSRASWALYNSKIFYDPNNPYYMARGGLLIIVNFSKPVSSLLYIATAPCIEGSNSFNTSSNWNLYALINPKALDVKDFCTISRWTWVSIDFGDKEQINSSSYNYERIHNIMADGFDPTFFCFFDFYSIYKGHQGCRSFLYTGGKHRLTMKFYRNFA
ncbi:hypothetical protein ACJRO7_006323 [Eucalyptus globulus]|uniref:Wall-associated receptor kinase galacturonan-binding domain-containing protein n=1 Tax=Eucalyptus globulus TaxID=34317 RepID=A0ABD3IIZ2_EUCGL